MYVWEQKGPWKPRHLDLTVEAPAASFRLRPTPDEIESDIPVFEQIKTLDQELTRLISLKYTEHQQRGETPAYRMLERAIVVTCHRIEELRNA